RTPDPSRWRTDGSIPSIVQRPSLAGSDLPSGSLPSLVAIDLVAESCRVYLLTPGTEGPQIRLVHRFPNAPVSRCESLFWNLDQILLEIERGLLRCGEQGAAPVASIGVDGWAVDYVWLGGGGPPIGFPFCYRGLRTEAIVKALKGQCPPGELFALSGAQ